MLLACNCLTAAYPLAVPGGSTPLCRAAGCSREQCSYTCLLDNLPAPGSPLLA